MRQLTATIKEIETKDGRFWIHSKRDRWILCIRKYGPEPKKIKAGEGRPWEWVKLGDFESPEAAKKRADDSLESNAPLLEWI